MRQSCEDVYQPDGIQPSLTRLIGIEVENYMRLILILSVIMMTALFLMLYAGVGLIQDKKYFTSAPQELQDLIPEHTPERFRGAHMTGWILMIISVVLLAGCKLYAGWDGIRNEFTFHRFFLRYLVMMLLLKAFDILFFDLFLLCNSNFYGHFYPQVQGHTDMHLFGFNAKSHIIHLIACVPISMALAGICTIL